jgi:hypothetical protein
MKGNINNPGTKYTPAFICVDAINYTMAAAGGGWIETDLSATVGTTPRLWLINARCLAAVDLGARVTGETKAPIVPSCYDAAFIVPGNATGHFDLVRNPGQVIYYSFVGYFN